MTELDVNCQNCQPFRQIINNVFYILWNSTMTCASFKHFNYHGPLHQLICINIPHPNQKPNNYTGFYVFSKYPNLKKRNGKIKNETKIPTLSIFLPLPPSIYHWTKQHYSTWARIQYSTFFIPWPLTNILMTQLRPGGKPEKVCFIV